MEQSQGQKTTEGTLKQIRGVEFQHLLPRPQAIIEDCGRPSFVAFATGHMAHKKIQLVPLTVWHLLPLKTHLMGHITTMSLAVSRFNAQRRDTLFGVIHFTFHGTQGDLLSCFIDSDGVFRHTV